MPPLRAAIFTASHERRGVGGNWPDVAGWEQDLKGALDRPH